MFETLIQVDLPAVVEFGDSENAFNCKLNSTSSDFSELFINFLNTEFSDDTDIDFKVYLPLERSPIKCKGTILSSEEIEGCSAKVIVNHIGRIDQRRLELFMEKRAMARGLNRGGYFAYGTV
ncbi:hypothetical protein GF312_15700 [Candidatus Poribacteria bacterium]|nr:hypothetical protein [Candidatus Poribacteria bacterium]